MDNNGISIGMPCLKEEKTLAICIEKAKKSIDDLWSGNGEVIIADNGSTDSSVHIAESLGARSVHVSTKGYGAALQAGINAAEYEYIIMGDADDSYDFSNLADFKMKLDEGYDLVMGNRFLGGIKDGAMPWSHRYIGNPILSGIGRIFYRTKIRDFHCGLRAFRKSSVEKLNLCTTGMEFASEMVVKSVLFDMKITEVPCVLYPDGRDRPPHLRSIPDGLRHLLFLLIYSPKWLFLLPGIVLSLVGAVMLVVLFITPIQIFNIRLETITMFYASIALLLGVQAIQFSLFTNIYGRRIGQFPNASSIIRRIEGFMQAKGFAFAIFMIVLGAAGVIFSLTAWGSLGFGELSDHTLHRGAILSGTILVLGFHLLLSCFFVNVLHMGGEN